jgi:hypothetical protein
MFRIKIVIIRSGTLDQVVSEIAVQTESAKRVTKSRIARALADAVPGFRRRRGRFAIAAGAETLPVLERTPNGWQAWRLMTGSKEPSGFEPPLPGRVGKANSSANPFADRSKGKWERADISVV